MDTEFARTFLAVTAAGSFIGAAERLHVTQSTVSARIRTLEQQLGCRLFERNKTGATITDAGRRFQKHAALLVRTVEHAQHDIGLPRGFRDSVVVGARIGLWDGLLLDWLGALRPAMPDISFRAEIGFEADLMQGLIDGRIDIAVMYTPQRRPRLELRPLLDERLVLVASPAAGAEAPYIYVDWGPEFYAQHNASFPDAPGPALSVNVGWLGLRYLLDHGGSGYFPLRTVARLVGDGRLVRVANAPEFVLPAWLVCPEDRNRRLIDPIIGRLGDLAMKVG
jgi:LysR family transcriptional regulator, flagellar master operon regulator